MKKIYIIIALIITLFLITVLLVRDTAPKIKTPNGNYSVLLADTPAKRTIGLSGTEKLKNNNVMLFLFENLDYHGMWMKDMLINIDIVFLDENWMVINYFDDVSPSTYPTIYYPTRLAKYVIEMPSGERLRSGLAENVQVYYK